jgi:hypothetical protein
MRIVLLLLALAAPTQAQQIKTPTGTLRAQTTVTGRIIVKRPDGQRVLIIDKPRKTVKERLQEHKQREANR